MPRTIIALALIAGISVLMWWMVQDRWTGNETSSPPSPPVSTIIHEPETADRREMYDTSDGEADAAGALDTADRRVIDVTSGDLLPPRQDWDDRCAILVLRESYGSNPEEEARCGRRTYR